jgi:hypothetical protein
MASISKPFFVLPTALEAITSNVAYAGFPATNLGRFKSVGLTWKADATGGLWAQGQFASVEQIDFAALVGSNAQLGTQWRLRLGYSVGEVGSIGAPYDSGNIPLVPVFADDVGVNAISLDFLTRNYLIETPPAPFHSHLELPALQNASWWRIDITGHVGDFQCSSLVLGKKVEPSHFYNLDFEYSVRDLGSLDFTRWGVWDEEEGRIFRGVAFTLAWNSEAEYEAGFRPLIEKSGKRGVVYSVFDPSPSPYRLKRTYMGVLEKSPVAKGTRKQRTFSIDFELVSMI